MSTASSPHPRVTHAVDVLDVEGEYVSVVTFESRVGKHRVRLDLEQRASPAEGGGEAPVHAFLGFFPNGTHTSEDFILGDDLPLWPMLEAVETVIARAKEKYRTLGPRALALATAEREKALLRPRRAAAAR